MTRGCEYGTDWRWALERCGWAVEYYLTFCIDMKFLSFPSVWLLGRVPQQQHQHNDVANNNDNNNNSRANIKLETLIRYLSSRVDDTICVLAI